MVTARPAYLPRIIPDFLDERNTEKLSEGHAPVWRSGYPDGSKRAENRE